MMINKIQNLLDIYWRLIWSSLDNIRLMIKVTILLAIDKRYATSSILAVFQGFDNGNSTTMSCQTTNGKTTLIEHFIQRITK